MNMCYRSDSLFLRAKTTARKDSGRTGWTSREFGKREQVSPTTASSRSAAAGLPMRSLNRLNVLKLNAKQRLTGAHSTNGSRCWAAHFRARRQAIGEADPRAYGTSRALGRLDAG